MISPTWQRTDDSQDFRQGRWSGACPLSPVAPGGSSCPHPTPGSPGLTHTLPILTALTGGPPSYSCSDQPLRHSETDGLCPITISSHRLWSSVRAGAVHGNTYCEVTAGALLYVIDSQAFPELNQCQPVFLVHVKHTLWKSRKLSHKDGWAFKFLEER